MKRTRSQTSKPQVPSKTFKSSQSLKLRRNLKPTKTLAAATTPSTIKPTALTSLPGPAFTIPSARITPTHIYFYGGPLSNWNLGTPYSGSACLAYLLPELAELSVSHPPLEAFSTQLLANHDFVCGEQWMMALKGWLFERDLALGEGVLPESEFEQLQDTMMAPKASATASSEERAFYKGTLCKVLRTASPKTQKALGKTTRNLDPEVWAVASVPVVVACSLVRAEADPALGQIYAKSGKRKFVEGSPVDRIWGVGIKYNNKLIDDEGKWKGTNRLGRCHDEARRMFIERNGESEEWS